MPTCSSTPPDSSIDEPPERTQPDASPRPLTEPPQADTRAQEHERAVQAGSEAWRKQQRQLIHSLLRDLGVETPAGVKDVVRQALDGIAPKWDDLTNDQIGTLTRFLREQQAGVA